MSIKTATDEQNGRIIKDIGYEEESMKAKMRLIKEWYKKQPHLPQLPENDADKLFFAFLVGSKLRTEKTKVKIDNYFSYRSFIPAVYDIRDPTQPDVRHSNKIIQYFPLPLMTPEGYRVDILKFTPESTKQLTSKDIVALFKRIMFIANIRINDEKFCGGDYIIIDLENFHMSSITEIPISMSQKFALCSQEGLPLRVKGIFVINAPSFIETLVNIFKPFLKEKAKQRMNIFSGNHTVLYDYIPKEMLPKDYGGNEPSTAQLNADWQTTVESKRDWYLEDSNRKTNEKLRPDDNTYKAHQMFGIDGSFNKLTID